MAVIRNTSLLLRQWYCHYVLLNEKHAIEFSKTASVQNFSHIEITQFCKLPHHFIARFVLSGVNLLPCRLLSAVIKLTKESSFSKAILPHRVCDGLLQLHVHHGC